MEAKIVRTGPGEFRDGTIPRTVTVEHDGEQIELVLEKVVTLSPTFAMLYYTKRIIICHQHEKDA